MSSKYFHNLLVKDIDKQTKDSVKITFDIPADVKDDFKYVAGQYLTIKKNINGEDLRRSYSICTAPEEDTISIAVKKVEDGRFSSFAVDELKVGDALEVMHPTGNFIYNPTQNSKGQVVFFAAGSGITPVMSHIKHLLKTYPDIQIVLFYGNRNFESIIFREELEGIKNKYLTRFALYHVFTKEKIGVPIQYGRIDGEKCQRFSGKFFDPENTDAYLLCGPAEMIFSVKDALIGLGVDTSKIHFELFNTDGIIAKSKESQAIIDPKNDGLASNVSIKMDGDIFEFSVGYNGINLLDAALENGADLPYACKGGVCSTCKAKLTEGDVSMDLNYALEPDELEAGYILLCQAHPRSEKISVDFDQK